MGGAALILGYGMQRSTEDAVQALQDEDRRLRQDGVVDEATQVGLAQKAFGIYFLPSHKFRQSGARIV